jgi:hypothetical protein
MLHDSTIANGSVVPVVRFRNGKKTNFMNTNKKINEKSHPLKLLSFQSKNQNFLNPFLKISPAFFKFIKIIRGRDF